MHHCQAEVAWPCRNSRDVVLQGVMCGSLCLIACPDTSRRPCAVSRAVEGLRCRGSEQAQHSGAPAIWGLQVWKIA